MVFMSLRSFCAAAAVASAVVASSASAHVVLENREAPAGSYYKATFRVGHGCKGSPTTQIKITLPEGINTAKPQPKPGWSYAAVKAPVPVDPHAGHAGHGDHGPTATERTSVATWTGGPLADDQYDEFVLMLKLPDAPGTTLYFPVEQICVDGANNWVEIPAPGQSLRDLKSPAAVLKLTPKP
jgi:periplasmic copper chaperone A